MAQRTKTDPRHEEQQNKVSWTMQDCLHVKGGLFELSYKVKTNLSSKIVYTHNSLKDFVVTLYNSIKGFFIGLTHLI